MSIERLPCKATTIANLMNNLHQLGRNVINLKPVLLFVTMHQLLSVMLSLWVRNFATSFQQSCMYVNSTTVHFFKELFHGHPQEFKYDSSWRCIFNRHAVPMCTYVIMWFYSVLNNYWDWCEEQTLPCRHHSTIAMASIWPRDNVTCWRVAAPGFFRGENNEGPD